jgi:hypothetical protein
MVVVVIRSSASVARTPGTGFSRRATRPARSNTAAFMVAIVFLDDRIVSRLCADEADRYPSSHVT